MQNFFRTDFLFEFILIIFHIISFISTFISFFFTFISFIFSVYPISRDTGSVFPRRIKRLAFLPRIIAGTTSSATMGKTGHSEIKTSRVLEEGEIGKQFNRA